MKNLILVIATIVLLGFVSTQTHAAAYMKIGDIKGESMKDGHKDWIIIDSVQFSNGILMIKQKNGRKVRLTDGMYKFKDGKQYLVKGGKAKLVRKGKRSIIRAKTKTTAKPGIETEDIGVKRKKNQDDN